MRIDGNYVTTMPPKFGLAVLVAAFAGSAFRQARMRRKSQRPADHRCHIEPARRGIVGGSTSAGLLLRTSRDAGAKSA